MQLEKNKNPLKGFLWPLTVLVIVIVIMSGLIIALKIIAGIPHELENTAVKTMDKLFDTLSTKQKFDSTFGPIVSQERFRHLQFFKSNQVSLFRIIRYLGKHDKKNHDYTEFYKKESDKKEISKLPIFMNQYCEWMAKGTFEFNFYIDMGDLSKWKHKWNPQEYVLTLYPPDIEVNTPAELEPIIFTCITDSTLINENFTKEQLQKAITNELKQSLAEDQKKFFYEEARLAIKSHYMDFFELISKSKIILPEIIIIFPHEDDCEKKKQADFIGSKNKNSSNK